MTLDTLAQSILNGLMTGWIYVLMALGLTLVLSIVGMLQMAHGEVYMFGGYLTYYLSVGAGLHFVLAIVISALALGVLGIILEKLFFRPFRHGEFFRSVILITGLMLIMRTTGVVVFGATNKVMRTPFSGVINVAGVTLSVERLVAILVGVVFVVVLFYVINKTKIGQGMVAVSQDLQAAALQGINIDHVSSLAMFLGCSLAAVAGSLMGAIFTLSTSMGTLPLMKGIAVIILGGLGSLPGAVAGGLILGMIDGLVPPLLNSQMASLFSFLAIIIILLFKPTGLLGHASR